MKSKSKNPNYTPAIVCWKYTDSNGVRRSGEFLADTHPVILSKAYEFLGGASTPYRCGDVLVDMRVLANLIARGDDKPELIAEWKTRLLKLADNCEKPFYAYSGRWKFFDTITDLLKYSLSCNGKRGSFYIKSEKEK